MHHTLLKCPTVVAPRLIISTHFVEAWMRHKERGKKQNWLRDPKSCLHGKDATLILLYCFAAELMCRIASGSPPRYSCGASLWSQIFICSVWKGSTILHRHCLTISETKLFSSIWGQEVEILPLVILYSEFMYFIFYLYMSLPALIACPFVAVAKKYCHYGII